MKDVAKLSYIEVKRECARNGLGAMGTDSVLKDRLSSFYRGKTSEKTHVAEKDNSHLSPDVIPEAKQTSQVITKSNSDFETAEIVNDVKWQALKAKLEEIFKGRVSFYLDKGDNCINFTGGGFQAECITYTAPEKTILKIARQFVGRTIIVPNKNGYFGQSIEDARNG